MVSPLGTDLETQWDRAVRGESGVGTLTRFPYDENFPVRIAGQVGEIDAAPYPFLAPREMAHWTSPIYRHAMLVVHRALTASGMEITPELAPRVGITFSTAVGGLDAVIAADRLMVKDGKSPHPFTNPNSCINMVGGKVSILTGATGPITATITACATGATSMIIGSMFLRQGIADVVICGAVDFPLVEPIVAGFASMNGAYKHKKDQPEEPSRGKPALLRRPARLRGVRGSGLRHHRHEGIRGGARLCVCIRNRGMEHDLGRLPFRGPQPGHGNPLHRGKHSGRRHRAGGHRRGKRARHLDQNRRQGRV